MASPVGSSSTSLPPSTFFIKLLFEGRETKLGLHLKHINAPRADGGKQVVQILWGMDAVRNQVIHLVVR